VQKLSAEERKPSGLPSRVGFCRRVKTKSFGDGEEKGLRPKKGGKKCLADHALTRIKKVT